MREKTYDQRIEGLTMPLYMLPENKEAKIEEIRGGRGLIRRLSDMGFTYGTKVKMLHSSSQGPVLVDIRGSKIALGKGVSMKIYVKPDE